MRWGQSLRAISDVARLQYDMHCRATTALCSATTLWPRHNRPKSTILVIPPPPPSPFHDFAANVTLNSLHLAADDSLVFRYIGTRKVAVLRGLNDARQVADCHDASPLAQLAMHRPLEGLKESRLVGPPSLCTAKLPREMIAATSENTSGKQNV